MVVADTNIFVSALLLPSSVSAKALNKALELHTVVACRDPKDDKFLSLALAAEAHFFITGDQDLLVLHPFHEVAIVSPAVFMDTV